MDQGLVTGASETEFERSLRTLEDFFENGVVGLHLVDAHGVIRRANRAELELLGYTADEYIGRPIADFHADPEAIADILSRLSRGERLNNYRARLKHKDGSIRHVLISSSVLFRDGEFVNTRCFTIDVTDQVEAEAALKEQQARLVLAARTAKVGVWDWDLVTNEMIYSEEAKGIFGFDPDGPVTFEMVRDATHPEDFKVTWPMAERALDPAIREKAPFEYRIVRSDGQIRWVLAHGEAVFAGDGPSAKAVRYVGAIQDITERRAVEAALQESEERLRALADNLPNGMIYQMVSNSDGTRRFTFVSNNCERLNGVPAEAAVADAARLYSLIHPDDLAGMAAAEEEAIASGEPFDREVRMRRPDGSWRWSRLSSAPRRLPDDSILWDGIEIDIDDRRRAADALKEESRALGILNRAGAAVAADSDLERLVQTVIDGGVEITGAAFGAFFYNVLDEAGARYTLYSISGVERKAFEGFPMPRATEVFAPTFHGEGVVLSDDILADPRYGKNKPHKGMPRGHLPVRSYLATPVRSRTGEVLGGLFFGHPETSRFDQRAADLVVGLAGQAAVAIDNGRLFQAAQRELEQRRRAEAELQALNATLEERVTREVAERSKAEEALRQAQKMEAVGQLTGGVAHDFNNLLTVIIGGLDTIRRSKPGDEARVQRAAAMALQGAERAASLTNRLLAFSRRQPLKPSPADLNIVMRNMTELLHRTLGETIELEGVLAPRLWTVDVDPNQLESAILNLALNARDAMPDGGKLTIETGNTALDESYRAADAEVIPGQYVLVSVSDTGRGMDAETMGRVFEPFFTTKDVGKGTGLGLSMVYGFVKQSGGHVTVYSEPGQGTTVKLYFPRYHGQAGAVHEARAPDIPLGNRDEVVLVVEDNEDVRAYSVMVLNELGYNVLEAVDADAGLAILKTDQRVDLLFTDVVLPGKSGRELAELAEIERPGLRVLFTTGYSRNAIVHHGRLDPGVQLLSKPFTFEQLAASVRDLLDAPGNGAKRPPH